MKEKFVKKKVEDFVDSSEDESIVVEDPYPRLPSIDPNQISPKAKVRLKSIRNNKKILKKEPATHQHILNHSSIKIEFPAPLKPVKTIDALPSNPKRQDKYPDTVVPTFRGIKCNDSFTSAELFCFTRADWLETNHFASMTFKIAKIDIKQYTAAFLFKEDEFLEKYKHYNLSSLKKNSGDFEEISQALHEAAIKLKAFFEQADTISKSFVQWKTIFPTMRNIKDEKIAKHQFSLSEILSYIYVNSYDAFKSVMYDFGSTLKTLKHKGLKKAFAALEIPSEGYGDGLPHLSEGQIPRHPLLYAFGLKNYTKGSAQEASPLYSKKCKPKSKNVYLGKIMVTSNPNTLFNGTDKATYIPLFDAQHGNKIIAKTIVPENEIQHRAANLQGRIKNSVNIKLPKFHHEKMPDRYLAKYGLNKHFYKDFKKTFEFLLKNKEFGKFSWMYLESLLLAHLIHFHEAQLFNYCSQLAHESQKKILWTDRKSKKIQDPIQLEFSQSSEESNSSGESESSDISDSSEEKNARKH